MKYAYSGYKQNQHVWCTVAEPSAPSHFRWQANNFSFFFVLISSKLVKMSHFDFSWVCGLASFFCLTTSSQDSYNKLKLLHKSFRAEQQTTSHYFFVAISRIHNTRQVTGSTCDIVDPASAHILHPTNTRDRALQTKRSQILHINTHSFCSGGFFF